MWRVHAHVRLLLPPLNYFFLDFLPVGNFTGVSIISSRLHYALIQGGFCFCLTCLFCCSLNFFALALYQVNLKLKHSNKTTRVENPYSLLDTQSSSIYLYFITHSQSSLSPRFYISLEENFPSNSSRFEKEILKAFQIWSLWGFVGTRKRRKIF